MTKQSSGKTSTIVVILVIVLLLSLTAIVTFLLQKELERRKTAEGGIEQAKLTMQKFELEIKDLKKKNFVLEEKNKESDTRIDSLLDDLELEKGLREEAKKENDSLKLALDNESKSKVELRQKMEEELTQAQNQLINFQKQLEAAQSQTATLEAKAKEAEKCADLAKERVELDAQIKSQKEKIVSLEEKLSQFEVSLGTNIENEVGARLSKKTVPANGQGMEGRIISVDKDAEFVIFNLGEKDGVKAGSVMSIYRSDEYLGDVKVSRVQPEMSAADFIPPFSSQKVRKNDRIVSAQ